MPYVIVTAYDNRDRVISEWSEEFRSSGEAGDEYSAALTEAESQTGFDYTSFTELPSYTRATVNYTDGSATTVTIS